MKGVSLVVLASRLHVNEVDRASRVRETRETTYVVVQDAETVRVIATPLQGLFTYDPVLALPKA